MGYNDNNNGFSNSRLGDYVDVASRIVEFRNKYPNGSLQPANLDKPYEVVTIGDRVFIAYVAAAYRTPDDQRPGIGTAYEPFPGRTPYTKDSELQNAETAAWGRAIMAALAADSRKGIASAEEVRNRVAEREQATVPMTEDQRKKMFAGFGDLDITDRDKQLDALVKVLKRNISSRTAMSSAEADQVLAALAAKKRYLERQQQPA
jgi:hypothetical protein